jgi:hypothetical protein
MNKIIKDLYFLFVLLFSGLSISFFRDHNGLIVLWLLGLLIFWQKTIHPTKSLLIAIGVWLMYFAINSVLTKSFHPYFCFTYLAKIMIAMWLVTYYKGIIFKKYEDSIYFLTIISLIFYLFQTFIPNVTYEFLKSVDLSQNAYPGYYTSIIIYTINNVIGFIGFFPHNSGFTWEPGPFATFLDLAIFFNINREKFKLKNNLRLLIFILALITTQSTTGILGFFVIVLFFIESKVKSVFFKLISLFIALSIIVYLFINIPFLQNKIIDETKQDSNNLLEASSANSSAFSVGRFASFQLCWIDFQNYPIAGTGGKQALRFGNQNGSAVYSANGLANIMAVYGSIGILLFLFLIIKSGKWFSVFYRQRLTVVYPVLLLIISFGFGVIETPIFVTLWIFPIFMANNFELKKIKKY